MLIEFFSHVLAFDLVWIIELLLVNLHWLFAFIVTLYIFTGGKRVLISTVVIVASVWALNDAAVLMGWVFLVGNFLMLFYIVKFLVLKIAEETPAVENKIIWVNEISGLGIWVLYNLWYLGII